MNSSASFKVAHAENALGQCLTLNLGRPRQGMGLERFDLSFELFCGVMPISESLQIGVRQCRIMLHLEGCVIERGTAYKFDHQEGRISETSKGSSAREAAGTAECSAEAGLSLAGLFGQLKFGGKGEVKRQSKRTKETQVTPHLPLISFEGGNCWVVGRDRVGDERKDGGLLRGEYFNENRDGDGSPLPACWLNTIEGVDAPNVTVGVVVRMGDLRVVETERSVPDEVTNLIAGMVALKKMRRSAKKLHDGLHDGQMLVSVGAVSGAAPVMVADV